MLKLGIEPKTFALLARRSNQLSYSSTELVARLIDINMSFESFCENYSFPYITPPQSISNKQ